MVTKVMRRERKPRIVAVKRMMRTVICAGKRLHWVAERIRDGS